MSWGAVAIAGAGLVGGIISSNAQSNAASSAANAQSASAQAGIAEQQRQFDAIQKLLSPYVTAGTGALTGQQNLLGLNGSSAQQQAISALQSSPYFTSLKQQGTQSILANASATGGLRGGNTQAALAQFTPALLAQTIQNQYANLGALSSQGANAAAMTGNFGQNTANNVTGLLQQQGAAAAGNALAQGQAQSGYVNSLIGAIGTFGGYGGFSRMNGGGGGVGDVGSNLTAWGGGGF
jgi:hypothetical protein